MGKDRKGGEERWEEEKRVKIRGEEGGERRDNEEHENQTIFSVMNGLAIE